MTLWSGNIATLRMPQATQFDRPWLELKDETSNLLKDCVLKMKSEHIVCLVQKVHYP